MKPTLFNPSLYVITPQINDTASLLKNVRQALLGGANIVQYRTKLANRTLKLVQARGLHQLCREFNVPFIINDCLDLMRAVDAEGLHIGREDMPVEAARAALGNKKLLGVSCYNQLDLAQHAEQIGADYVTFGSFYASPTKPEAVHAPLSLLTEAKQVLTKPIIAIGGITPEHVPELLTAGADGVAVISSVFNAQDVEKNAQFFVNLLKNRKKS